MFRIENISKKYDGGPEPIRGLSAVINKGDVVALIGPSGTGKSTLLRCLNMLDPPTQGDIYYKDEKITGDDCDIPGLRQRVGMVFQSFNLFNHLTAIENIMMPQVNLLKKSRQEAYERGMELLAQVGLTDQALQYPGQLSGGQKQRVAIARAMAMEPEALLLDEPTSALDPTMVDEVNAVIKTLASTGMTILIVTHDMAFARDISSRVFYMDEGAVYEEGTPEEIFDHPKRPKTVQFIKKLFVLEADITDRRFDFSDLTKKIYDLMIRVKTFGNVWNNTVLLLDELINGVLFNVLEEHFHIHLRLECRKNSILICITYDGKELDMARFLEDKARETVGMDDSDDWMPVSARLIRNYADEIVYSREDEDPHNLLQITVSQAEKKGRR